MSCVITGPCSYVTFHDLKQVKYVMDEKKIMIVHDGTYTKLKVLKQTFAEVSEGQIVLPDNEPFYANELTLINSSQQ